MGRDRRGVAAASASSIQITFQYKGQRCREKIKLQPTPANLTRAERHRAAILLAIENGTFDYATTFPDSPNLQKFVDMPAQAITVEDFFTGWLKSQKSQVKASTHDGYRKIVDNLILPEFGEVMLANWKRRDVKAWLEKMDCGNKRLANIQSVIRAGLATAVDEDEILDMNFMTDYCYQKKEAPKLEDDIDPFTPEEQAAILAKCVPEMRNQVMFSFWTGLRPSELIALNWTDIDFRRGYVIVRKALTTAARGEIEDTKTASGRREVKMLAPSRQALLDQKAHTMLKGDPVFRNPGTGERWTGDQQIRDAWVRILKLAKVRYRWPYQARHTYASMMLSAGEHPMWVAKQMGHKDWTMIAKIYGKWMPAADTDAGGKAEGLFAPAEIRQQKAG